MAMRPRGTTKNKGGKGSSGRTTTTQGVYGPAAHPAETVSYRYEKRKPAAKKAAAKKATAKKKAR